ncbi:unnamed protein product [Cuscuta europaea]|uniref:Uncharacterized protein n=1 Tax=Cuscuta europaea TaxID=41803 RepID=A0A9P0ZJ51_CUSEU|nr:unnamed protein product [Cuscuta europaea]
MEGAFVITSAARTVPGAAVVETGGEDVGLRTCMDELIGVQKLVVGVTEEEETCALKGQFKCIFVYVNVEVVNFMENVM